MQDKNPSWVEQVYAIVRLIPEGRVTSYGAIAKCLNITARMVGKAMNNSTTATVTVPAHRVVNHSGRLTGAPFFATSTLMEELLKKEGVSVKNDKIINFSKHFWDPMQELKA